MLDDDKINRAEIEELFSILVETKSDDIFDEYLGKLVSRLALIADYSVPDYTSYVYAAMHDLRGRLTTTLKDHPSLVERSGTPNSKWSNREFIQWLSDNSKGLCTAELSFILDVCAANQLMLRKQGFEAFNELIAMFVHIQVMYLVLTHTSLAARVEWGYERYGQLTDGCLKSLGNLVEQAKKEGKSPTELLTRYKSYLERIVAEHHKLFAEK